MKKLISYSVFVLTSSLVLGLTAFFIKFGLKNEPNTVLVAKFYNSRFLAHKIQDGPETVILGVTNDSPVNPPVDSKEKCPLEFLETNSIVDFLVYLKKDRSFAARSIMAAEYDIIDYRGKANQNIKLLNLLKKENCLIKE